MKREIKGKSKNFTQINDYCIIHHGKLTTDVYVQNDYNTKWKRNNIQKSDTKIIGEKFSFPVTSKWYYCQLKKKPKTSNSLELQSLFLKSFKTPMGKMRIHKDNDGSIQVKWDKKIYMGRIINDLCIEVWCDYYSPYYWLLMWDCNKAELRIIKRVFGLVKNFYPKDLLYEGNVEQFIDCFKDDHQ